MLEALMQVTFYPKEEELYKDWPGYDATRILRPPFRLGDDLLFSGTITSDEDMYEWDVAYLVHVAFFTIDTLETYRLVEGELAQGKTYPIQLGNKPIGEAVLLEYCFSE